MSLKTRGSEKVPLSKSSYSRVSFCNQVLCVFGITLSNHEYRRRNSQSITVRSSCWSRRSAQTCWTNCLTESYFHRTVYQQKNIPINLTVSRSFVPKNYVIGKNNNSEEMTFSKTELLKKSSCCEEIDAPKE